MLNRCRLPRALLIALLLAAPAFAPALGQAPSLATLNDRVITQLAAPPDQLRQTLAARATLFATLLRTQPAQARAAALPAATRAAILRADPAAAPYLEQDVPLTGELTAAVADDWQHDAAQTLYTLHTPTADVDLTFTTPTNPEALLHRPITVTGLSLPGILAAETLREATPAECAATPAATVHPETAPATCSTFGTQKIAVLIVHYPNNSPAYPTGLDSVAYWQSVINGSTPSVNTFWNEVSYGQTAASADIYNNITLTQAYDCTQTSALQTAAIAAAAGTVDFTQYNRVLIVFPVTSCTFGGLGSIGCSSATTTIGHQYSTTWIPVTPTYNTSGYPQMWGGVSHELGHNLGLNHANTLDFGALSLGPLDFSATNPGTVGAPTPNATTTPLTAVNTEYGDHFALIGYPWTSGGPYSAQHRVKLLGWIPQADSRDITASGQYTLTPAENSSGLRALHVLRDPASGSWLWLEFHQPQGFYTPANIAAFPGNTLTTGAQIHYENAFANSLYTYLLDMTPTATPNNFYDGTLAPGTSWSDPYSLLTLTAGTQTSSTLPITVSYDTPCATVSLSAPTIPAAGGSGSVQITAPNSCSWTVSSNASWLTFPGVTAGTGNSSIPYTAAANTASTQRLTYLTAQRQSLPLIQSGSSITITAVTPHAGTSVTGAIQPFTLAFTDTLGLSDTTQLNLDFVGNPDCQVAAVLAGSNAYLYVLSGSTYSSGIPAGTTGQIASPVCTIDGATSKYTATGTSATLTVGVSFASNFLGAHTLSASAVTSAGYGSLIPFGYWTVTAPVVIPITTPVITWPTPAAIPYGTALTATQLNATTTVPGTFTYSPVLGTIPPAGTNTLTTTFTPTDLTTYATATTTNALTVTAAPLAATANAATRIYGTPNPVFTGTLSGLVNADPITAAFTSAALPSSPAGAYPIAVTLADPANRLPNYTLTNTPATLTITRAASTLTLTAPATGLTGTPVTLTATTASTTTGVPTGSALFYAGQSYLGTATFNAGIATLATTLPIGTFTLTAASSGDTNFTPTTAPSTPIIINGLPDYTLTPPTPSTAAIAAGQTATFTFTATPVYGFNAPITFACSPLPAHTTCTFAPSTLTPAGAPVSTTLTLATSVAAAANTPAPRTRRTTPLIALATLLLIPFLRRRRLATLLSCLLFLTLAGCTPTPAALTPASTATPAGTYTITVTSTSGTLTHATPVSLTIN